MTTITDHQEALHTNHYFSRNNLSFDNRTLEAVVVWHQNSEVTTMVGATWPIPIE